MEYTINKLAKLACVSTRTLRYYDQIELLCPRRVSNGYRIYGQQEVDLLQQILLYRELDMPLGEIKRIVRSQEYDSTAALQGHLLSLKAKRAQMDALIANVEKTIAASKGEIVMNNTEKFEGLKRRLIEENETNYGPELRATFGDQAIDASNVQLMGLSPEQYARTQELSEQINSTLKAAFEQGDPSSELSQQVCSLHKEWLGYFWSHYSKEAHLGLAQTYVDDPRFTAYYDTVAEGCAKFLRDALEIFCA